MRGANETQQKRLGLAEDRGSSAAACFEQRNDRASPCGVGQGQGSAKLGTWQEACVRQGRVSVRGNEQAFLVLQIA
jgi:hypothetical protein